MRKSFQVLCGLAAGLLATTAMAQESYTDSGLYVSFAAGGQDGNTFAQRASSTFFTETYYTEYTFTGLAAIGYQWAPPDAPGGVRLEVEGSYRNSPLTRYTTSAGLDLIAEGSLETIGAMANGLVDFNLGRYLSPYVGIGTGVVRVARRDVSVGGIPISGKFAYSSAFQWMAGIGYRISPGTIAGLDFKHVEVQRFGWPDFPGTNVFIEYNEILFKVRLVG